MPPEKQPREASLDVEVIQWREPYDHLPESRRIFGPVNGARRSAGTWSNAGRRTAESAAKERQCVKVPSVEGAWEERHQSNRRGGLVCSEDRRTSRPQPKGQLGKYRQGWRGAVERHRPRRHRLRAPRRAPVREETQVEGAPQAPVSPGNLDIFEVALSSETYRWTRVSNTPFWSECGKKCLSQSAMSA